LEPGRESEKKMPQLDRFAWASQVFWLLFFFFLFYFSLVKFIFPAISGTLKLRNKLFDRWRADSVSVSDDKYWSQGAVNLFVDFKNLLKKQVYFMFDQRKTFLVHSSFFVYCLGRLNFIKFMKAVPRRDFKKKR
jgi:hypothetical protein